MADEDTKKLIRSVKDIVELVKKKVDTIQIFQSTASNNIRLMKEQQSLMNEKLDGLTKDVKEMSENVDAARGDIELLHMDVKGIRDKEGLFHSRNKREIDEIKTHLGMPLMADTPEV